MSMLYEYIMMVEWQQVVMWAIGGLLIFLAIKYDMEPTLLLPMGFGAILVNLPLSGAVTQGGEEGIIDILFNACISNELFPLLLFIGIGAMIDFGPLLQNPKLLLFGAAAQFGIFMTFSLASLLGFDIKDAASIGIIGAADGPTSIFVANYLGSNYIGAGAYNPASRYKAYNYQKRTAHPYGIRAEKYLQNRSHSFPHNHNGCSRLGRASFGCPHRLFDVRQSYKGMRSFKNTL